MSGTETVADTRAHLNAVLTDLARVVDGIDGAERAAATPCTEYDVATLLDHVVGWLDTFSAGYADPEGRAPRADLSGYRAPDDAAAAVRDAAATLDRALAAGAATRPLTLGEAAMPGEMALSMILWEYQVHGWDLAVATGQPWSPPDAGLEASLVFAPMMLTDDYQGEGKTFGPRVAVADDAPALDRLVAISGRDPGWSR
ncbi:TIGR03086 family metal-binding protein [Actinomycetospora endophytica]|uniref:TIGR03086 family metal-binding protein n=1 Tax=Actinomycetospora endophytica TaxID=2291215 RepID=A0ABS8P2Y2_9PSEU|nr:TIGR03086 family metal-binding protein [Actinomycetospora endophytica]MCD2192593.1 TIGR03086 family metal-binding protein [Actinomycetospora endophytica]